MRWRWLGGRSGCRRDPRVARPDRVDRRRAAPCVRPDPRPRPRPGGAAQPQQGDPHALSRPDADVRASDPAARTNVGWTGGGRRVTVRVDGGHSRGCVPKAGWALRRRRKWFRRICESSRRSRSERCWVSSCRRSSDLAPKPEAEPWTTESAVARQFINAFTADDQGADLDGRGRGRQAPREPVPCRVRPGRCTGPSGSYVAGGFSLHGYAAHGPSERDAGDPYPGGWPRPGAKPADPPAQHDRGAMSGEPGPTARRR